MNIVIRKIKAITDNRERNVSEQEAEMLYHNKESILRLESWNDSRKPGNPSVLLLDSEEYDQAEKLLDNTDKEEGKPLKTVRRIRETGSERSEGRERDVSEHEGEMLYRNRGYILSPESSWKSSISSLDSSVRLLYPNEYDRAEELLDNRNTEKKAMPLSGNTISVSTMVGGNNLKEIAAQARFNSIRNKVEKDTIVLTFVDEESPHQSTTVELSAGDVPALRYLLYLMLRDMGKFYDEDKQ